MAKGILYVMTSAMPNMVKIGKTSIDNFEMRMYSLERNGYANLSGMRRKFAIVVDDCNRKERMLHTVLDGSRIKGTELFNLDPDLAAQLLAAFDGVQYYPQQLYAEKDENQAGDNEDKQKEEGQEGGASAEDGTLSSGQGQGGPETEDLEQSREEFIKDVVHQTIKKEHDKKIKKRNDEAFIRRIVTRTLKEEGLRDFLPSTSAPPNEAAVVNRWIKDRHLGMNYFLTMPTDCIYADFEKWSQETSLQIGYIPGKKTTYKAIREIYGFANKTKQRSNGKRFFIPKTDLPSKRADSHRRQEASHSVPSESEAKEDA